MEAVFFTILFDILRRTAKIYLGVVIGYFFVLSPLKKYRTNFIDLTMNVLTPILIFVSILQVEQSEQAIYPIIAAIFVTVAGIIVPKLLASDQPKPSEICTAAFPNALNFPFPLIFALSPDSLGAAGIFLVTQIVLRNTVGLWISGVKMGKSTIKEIISFPPIWAVILGLIGRILFSDEIRVNLSTSENQIVYWIVEIGIFATLMTLGFSIRKPSKEHVPSYFRVGLTRFLITPIIFFLFIIPFQVPAVTLIALIVQVMAPPAVYNGIYAERFNLDTSLTSNTTLVLTIVALILVPLEFYLLEINFL